MAMKMGFIGGKKLEELERAAMFAAANGFEGLEFDYWKDFAELNDENVRQRREILDRHGVGVSGMGLWGFNHLSPDKAERAQAHDMLGRAIEFGKVLGAAAIITGGGDIPDAPLGKKVEEFCEVFPPFLEKIEAAGMKAAFYAVHGASFFDSIEAYEAVWEKLPQVGIKYDPANWAQHGDDYLLVVRTHGDKIAHVHIKEHMYRGGELISQPPAGMGDIAWGKVMAFLYEHGYDGYLSIEPHGPIWSKGEMRDRMCLLTRKYISQFLL